MKYVMYLDVLFLVNMGMNLVILWLTGYCCRRRTAWWRYLLGSCMGSGLLVLMLWLPLRLSEILYVCLYGAIGGIMCWFTFCPKTVRRGLLCYGCMFMVSFLLGGMINWLYFSTPFGEWLNSLFNSGDIRFGELFILVLTGGSIFVWLSSGARRILREQAADRYQVSLYFDEKTNLYGLGFVDTGNFLREPVTGRPVMVAEAGWLQEVLPRPYQVLVDTYITEGRIDYDRIVEEQLTKCRWIPYQSVGEQQGEMLGIQCRKIILRNEESCLIREQVIVGISRTPLMKNQQYQILLQSEILEGEKICYR